MIKKKHIYTHLATALIAALIGGVIAVHIHSYKKKSKGYGHEISPHQKEKRVHQNQEDIKAKKPMHTGRIIFYLEEPESGISKKTYRDEGGEYVERNNRKVYLQEKGKKRRERCEENPKSVELTGGRYDGKKVPGYVCKDKEGGRYLDVNDIPL